MGYLRVAIDLSRISIASFKHIMKLRSSLIKMFCRTLLIFAEGASEFLF